MKFIADFHLHSKYSRATSPDMNLESLDKWAKIKGLKVLGTGDFTHPEWSKSLKEKLAPAEPGLYKRKESKTDTRFILTCEISSVYSKGGKVRRTHTLLFAPSLETARKINRTLNKVGNLKSDGRPILGLDVKELTKIALDASPDCMIVPAHAWTPWFSVFGSKSGFDSIEACFGKYSDKITAIETGLSSDPIMNWSIPELERRQIVSFSDAHSGAKLGREATVFKKKQENYDYFDLIKALKQDKTGALESAFTIEFFPEEGKYHYSGHRLCGVRLSPAEVKAANGLCPKCHKPLTIGVMDRVQELADQLLEEADLPTKLSHSKTKLIYPPKKNRPPFVSIIPLMELISHNLKVASVSKKVLEKYHFLIEQVGSEFAILLFKDLKELENLGETELAQLITKMRQRQIRLEPGYDGVFGKIEVNVQTDNQEQIAQNPLF